MTISEPGAPSTPEELPVICPVHDEFYRGTVSAYQTIQEIANSGIDIFDVKDMLLPEDTELLRAYSSFEASRLFVENAYDQFGRLSGARNILSKGSTTEIEPYVTLLADTYIAGLGDRKPNVSDIVLAAMSVNRGLLSANKYDEIDARTSGSAGGRLNALSKLIFENGLDMGLYFYNQNASVGSNDFIEIVTAKFVGAMFTKVDTSTLCSHYNNHAYDAKARDKVSVTFGDKIDNLVAGTEGLIESQSILQATDLVYLKARGVTTWYTENMKKGPSFSSETVDAEKLGKSSDALAGQLRRLQRYPISSEAFHLDTPITDNAVVFHDPNDPLLPRSQMFRGGEQPLAIARFLSDGAPDDAADLAKHIDVVQTGINRHSVHMPYTNNLVSIDSKGELWLGLAPDKNGMSLKKFHAENGLSEDYEVLRARILQHLFDATVADFSNDPTDSIEMDLISRTEFLKSFNASEINDLFGGMHTTRKSRAAGRTAREAMRKNLRNRTSPLQVNPEDGEVIPPVETAQIALELNRMLDQDTYKKALEIENNGGPLQSYVQFLILGSKLAAALDPKGELISDEDMKKRLHNSSLSLALKSVHYYHSIIFGMAKVSGQSVENFTSNISGWDITKLIPAIAGDINTYMTRGLQGGNETDGKYANFMTAMTAVMGLNTVLLMHGKGDDVKYAQELYVAMGSHGKLEDPKLNSLAQQYAEHIIFGGTDMAILRSYQEMAGDNKDIMTKRASELVLLTKGLMLFKDVEDRPKAREQWMEAIHAMSGMKIANLKRVNALIDALEGRGVKPESIEDIIQATQVNWEILPPGKLLETAQGIVDEYKKNGVKVDIDLERLLALDKIRQSWGADRSYYVKGTLGKRKVVKANGKEEPDKYILLILQELDENGNVLSERAVAETPIVGKHAMYVYRPDVSVGTNWREVMSLPKDYARALKARALKHTAVKAGSQVAIPESMAIKVGLLMNCPPEEFFAEFKGDRLYNRQNFVGNFALNATD